VFASEVDSIQRSLSILSVIFSLCMLRMRELTSQGSIKDVAVIMASYGFNIGDRVERTADKSTGHIESFDEKVVRVKIAGDVVAAVPIESFLKRQWHVLTSSKGDPVELKPSTDMMHHSFMNCRLATFIQLELLNLTAQHRTCLEGVTIFTKPRRGIMVTKPFAKGKLTLIPTSFKVLFSKKLPHKTALSVLMDGHDFNFTVQAVSTPKTADDIAVPFWFVARDNEQLNMEIVYVKSSSHPEFNKFHVQIPIARNSKPLKEGDWLFLPKLQEEVEALVPVGDPPAAKKQRRNP
jgi:hypothetical protein